MNFSRYFLIAFLVLAIKIPLTQAADMSHASIFAYYNIDDGGSDLSLAPEQFESHLAAIRDHRFPVLPLTEIARAFQEKSPLPDRTIALTFDNPSRATMDLVFPLIQSARIPVTIFITTDSADYSGADSLNWDDLRQLQKSRFVTIGLIGKFYKSFLSMDAAQRQAYLNAAIARFENQLGARPVILAYPYGDYDSALVDLLKERRIAAAAGTQSGVAAPDNLYALPRFTMTDRYGDQERFVAAASALPLQAGDVIPQGSLSESNPPAIGFTVKDSAIKAAQLNCFSNADQKIEKTILEDRVELRYPARISSGRIRVNCTANLKDDSDQTRLIWWGMNLLVR